MKQLNGLAGVLSDGWMNAQVDNNSVNNSKLTHICITLTRIPGITQAIE